MPPLHRSFHALTLAIKPTHFPSVTLPASQARAASVLSNLSPVPSSIRNKKRLGRGPASGKGKTSGRGHKGQKQHGKVPRGFQGGQTPVEVTHGKRGIQTDVLKMDLRTLNVDRLQSWVDQGRIDPSKMITIRELAKTRCLHGVGDGVKLLARNAEALSTPLHITVSRASGAAIAAIEQAGGSVQTRYYTKSSIKRIMQGDTHPFLSRLSPAAHTPEPAPADGKASEEIVASAFEAAPRVSPATGEVHRPTQSAIPTSYPPPDAFRYRLPDAFARRDLEYYRDPAHRGYLAYQVEEGAGPSLYFKSPVKLREEVIARKRAKRLTKAGQGDREEKIDTGRIW